MSLKAKVEAIIYAAEEPVTLEQLAVLLREAVVADLAAIRVQADGGEAAADDDAGTYAAESAQLEELDLGAAPGSTLSDDADEPRTAVDAAVTGKRAANRSAVRSAVEIAADKAIRARLRELLAELVADYATDGRGMEIRQIAGGYRLTTKPEHHDVVRAFAKSLKPPIRLSLAALETLAVIAYKQPVTAPEIAEIRGVDSAGVLGTLLDRRLITTAGRKQVIGRPMQYKTSKDFLVRFGMNDVGELPSMEEFSQLASEATIEVSSEPQAAPSLFPPEDSASPEGEPSQSQINNVQIEDAQAEAAPEAAPQDGESSGD